MPGRGEKIQPEAMTPGMRDELSLRLIASIRACHPDDATEITAAFLDGMKAGIPGIGDLFGNAREDAAFWADLATPVELEAFAAAALRKIERRDFCAAARKRIFATIWESLGDDDRRAFLGRVDPQGKFRGKA